MPITAVVNSANRLAAAATRRFESLFLLTLRIYVAWQFLKSGWLKLADWDTTLALFQDEYRVPLLSPPVGALVGTAGETVFPLLLILGFLSRYAALGLSAVNLMAVVAYAHVLLSEGFEAALGQHYLWGLMLLTLLVFGPGRYSLDAALQATRGGSS